MGWLNRPPHRSDDRLARKWIGSAKASGAFARASLQCREDRIRHAVDSELSSRGFAMQPADGQASVVACGSTHTQSRMETFYTGFGGGW